MTAAESDNVRAAAVSAERAARFKEAIFIGAFAVVAMFAMFGWIAALGWGMLKLAFWLA